MTFLERVREARAQKSLVDSEWRRHSETATRSIAETLAVELDPDYEVRCMTLKGEWIGIAEDWLGAVVMRRYEFAATPLTCCAILASGSLINGKQGYNVYSYSGRQGSSAIFEEAGFCWDQFLRDELIKHLI